MFGVVEQKFIDGVARTFTPEIESDAPVMACVSPVRVREPVA